VSRIRYLKPGFFSDEDKYEYVNCRRCSALLLVGRDVADDGKDAAK